jgi:hypothetical protein
MTPNPKFADTPAKFRVVRWLGGTPENHGRPDVVLMSDPSLIVGLAIAATPVRSGPVAQEYRATDEFAKVSGIYGVTIDAKPHVCQRCRCNMPDARAGSFFCSAECMFDARCACGAMAFRSDAETGEYMCPACDAAFAAADAILAESESPFIAALADPTAGGLFAITAGEGR